MTLVTVVKCLLLLTLSLPGSVMETFNLVLTFESVDEILWCHHSNETSSVVLSHGTLILCGSRKYPYPHHRGNWEFRRGGGSKTQENPAKGGLNG